MFQEVWGKVDCCDALLKYAGVYEVLNGKPQFLKAKFCENYF